MRNAPAPSDSMKRRKTDMNHLDDRTSRRMAGMSYVVRNALDFNPMEDCSTPTQTAARASPALTARAALTIACAPDEQMPALELISSAWLTTASCSVGRAGATKCPGRGTGHGSCRQTDSRCEAILVLRQAIPNRLRRQFVQRVRRVLIFVQRVVPGLDAVGFEYLALYPSLPDDPAQILDARSRYPPASPGRNEPVLVM
jgi:hypothetical protein